MKLLNISVEIEKYQKAFNQSPNNMAWMEWLDCLYSCEDKRVVSGILLVRL